MTIDLIRNSLVDMMLRHSRVINWQTVTKWSDEKFEVGTWGKEENLVNLDEALKILVGGGER